MLKSHFLPAIAPADQLAGGKNEIRFGIGGAGAGPPQPCLEMLDRSQVPSGARTGMDRERLIAVRAGQWRASGAWEIKGDYFL
jgi:hypothetical protein